MYNCTIYENMVEMAFNVKCQTPFFHSRKSHMDWNFCLDSSNSVFRATISIKLKVTFIFSKNLLRVNRFISYPFPILQKQWKKKGGGRILQPYTKNRLLQIDTWKFCMLLNYIYTVNDFTEGNKFYGIHGMC